MLTRYKFRITAIFFIFIGIMLFNIFSKNLKKNKLFAQLQQELNNQLLAVQAEKNFYRPLLCTSL